MAFSLNEDRGTILQITFDVLYPNGQLKTVAMPLAETSFFKDVRMIIFDEEMLTDYLDKCGSAGRKDEVLRKWNSKDVMLDSEGGGEAPYKPAMALIAPDGDVILKCGGHGSSGHIGTGGGGGAAVVRYM